MRRFDHAVRRVFDQSMVSTQLRAFYNPLIAFLPQVGLAAMMLVGGRQAINGTISVGDFVAFYGYVLMLTGPMRMLGVSLGMAQRAVGSGARVFQILDRRPQLTAPARRPAAALRAAAGADARRLLRLRRGRPAHRGAARHRPGRARGADGGRGGRHGLGQDHAGHADPAPLRRHRRHGDHRRRGRARRGPGLAAPRDRAGVRRRLPVQRHAARQHRLRAAGRRPRRRARRRPARRAGGADRGAARGLRDAGGRARADALRRPAPARRDRPRAAGRAAHPDPGRRHLQRGRHHRGQDQGRAVRGDGGPHHVRDRPPDVHDLPGRRDHRARGGADHGPRHPRGAGRAVAASTARSPSGPCPTRRCWPGPSRARRWRGCERRHPPPGQLGRAARRARAHQEAAQAAGAAAPLPRARGADVRRAAAGHGRHAGARLPGRPRHRRRHPRQGRQRAHLDHDRLPGRRGAELRRHLRPDLPHELGRPARAAGPAPADLRPPPDPVDRLLLAQQGGGADLAHDQRRGGAGPADLRRRGHALLLDAAAVRHRARS